MGRHLKKGLEYFNIDCVQEDSLNYLEAKHGISGYGVLVKLWRKIYMVDGYYCDWSEKNIYLFSKEVGVDVEQIKTIVETCFSEGIFHREIYKNSGVLTSHGVQKRWLRIVVDAKRKDVQMRPELVISAKTPEETGFTPEEITKTHGESTQSKVKESRVNKSKGNDSGAPAVPAPKKVFIVPSHEEVRQYFKKLMGDTSKPVCWPEDKCFMEADTLMDHYTANGWVQGRGKPIKDWKAACRNWIRNRLNGNFSPISGNKMAENENSVQKIETPVPKIDKVASEINFLFGRYLENPEHCTIISVDVMHYNYLKNANRMGFPDDRKGKIRNQATEILIEKKIEVNEANLLPYMKKIGVIEFFKDLKEIGSEAVFYAEN